MWYDAGGRSTGTLGLAARALRDREDLAGRLARDLRAIDDAVGFGALAGRPHARARCRSSRSAGGTTRRSGRPMAGKSCSSAIARADRPSMSRPWTTTRAGRLLARTPFPFNAPNDWSPDGQRIVITVLESEAAEDVWILPASGGDLIRTPEAPRAIYGGPVSPDGHWLAYFRMKPDGSSCTCSRFRAGHRVQISEQGASSIWWTRDGRQLLYLAADLHSMWRVDVAPGTTFGVGRRSKSPRLRRLSSRWTRHRIVCGSWRSHLSPVASGQRPLSRTGVRPSTRRSSGGAIR